MTQSDWSAAQKAWMGLWSLDSQAAKRQAPWPAHMGEPFSEFMKMMGTFAGGRQTGKDDIDALNALLKKSLKEMTRLFEPGGSGSSGQAYDFLSLIQKAFDPFKGQFGGTGNPAFELPPLGATREWQKRFAALLQAIIEQEQAGLPLLKLQADIMQRAMAQFQQHIRGEGSNTQFEKGSALYDAWIDCAGVGLRGSCDDRRLFKGLWRGDECQRACSSMSR